MRVIKRQVWDIWCQLLEILKLKSTVAKIKNSIDDLNQEKGREKTEWNIQTDAKRTKDEKHRKEPNRHMDMVGTCNLA